MQGRSVRLVGRDHARLLGGPASRRLAAWTGPVTEWALVPAERLGSVAPGSLDLITSVGALCFVDDMDAVLAAAREALAPGGRLRFVEHVGRVGAAGRLQSWVDPFWSRLSFGCHVDRDVSGALRRAGFSMHSLDRFTLSTPVVVLRRWVRGVAAPVEVDQ